MTPDPLDDLFHGCALSAYLEVAAREQGWPGSEATRQLAYRLYEDAIAEKNRRVDANSETVLLSAREGIS
jgi:hypothetical protein